MKVESSSGQFAYPDVIIVCGDPIFRDEKRDVLLNPIVLVEVLSPLTESMTGATSFITIAAFPRFRNIC
jgi:Uma2 family endonuclease